MNVLKLRYLLLAVVFLFGLALVDAAKASTSSGVCYANATTHTAWCCDCGDGPDDCKRVYGGSGVLECSSLVCSNVDCDSSQV